ncbi:MAG: tetratricopeptide repeat protein [Bryobacteraceae bacterium]
MPRTKTWDGWAPKFDSAYFDDSFSVRPLGLLGWGITLAEQGEYSPDERVRLSDAAHEWEVSFQKDSTLLGSYRAAWGKCYFLSGDYAKAAEQFDLLLAHGCGLPSEADTSVRSRLYQNAAECYVKSGAVETAARLLEQCAQEFPETPGLWLQLARVYISSPLDVDLAKVQACLRKAEEIDPSFRENPLGSIALTLGEVAGSDLPAKLRKVAESSPADLLFMTSVVSRHWPSFRSLDERSRKEWVGAALWLWSTSRSWERDLLRRRVAGTFADIVEDQLRRLFERFRQEKGNSILGRLSLDPKPGSQKDKFLKYLEKGSYLNLGDMISEIEDTRRLPEPRYPDLKAWLQRNARRLSQNWDTKRAWKLNDLRRASSHRGADFSEQDAVDLYT